MRLLGVVPASDVCANDFLLGSPEWAQPDMSHPLQPVRVISAIPSGDRIQLSTYEMGSGFCHPDALLCVLRRVEL